MNQKRRIIRAPRYSFTLQIGGSGICDSPLIASIIRSAVKIGIAFTLLVGTCQAQTPASNLVPDQQAFLGKLVQLQNVIDSASVGIKAQLLAAQTSISQISGQRIAQNIKADDEISKDLLKISAQLVVAAIKPDEADLKGIISDGLKVTTSLSLQLGNNAAFGQLLSEANKQLNAANSNAAALEKLRDDKARIVVEGQKLGLLPNITYNAQAGTFTTASPSRATAATATAAPATSQPAMPATATTGATPTTPDPLALAILYEVMLHYVYDVDLPEVERLATKSLADKFAKCMIEHRTQNILSQSELWEYLTRSAQLLREKNAVAVYWPPAQRERQLGSRRKEFEFHVATKKYFTDGALGRPAVNALYPRSFRIAAPMSGTTLMIQGTGFSNYETCLKKPVPASRPQQSDDDE